MLVVSTVVVGGHDGALMEMTAVLLHFKTRSIITIADTAKHKQTAWASDSATQTSSTTPDDDFK